jgi:hypothetical protein
VAKFLSILFTVFGTLIINPASAQDDGPSIENLNKNSKAISAETQRLKEEERRQEILSYIYMTVGFGVVIAVAWITTVMARKRTKKEIEEKQRFILRQQELRKNGHHPHHAHGHAHGHLHRTKR